MMVKLDHYQVKSLRNGLIDRITHHQDELKDISTATVMRCPQVAHLNKDPHLTHKEFESILASLDPGKHFVIKEFFFEASEIRELSDLAFGNERQRFKAMIGRVKRLYIK